MRSTTLNSSVFDVCSYDDRSQSIILRFKNGVLYRYNAPDIGPAIDMAALYEQFVNAESPGRFFQSYIRRDLVSTKINSEEDL